ncbi:hypothetical protein K469DRAFT_556660, partial [Zopfia rhizophila CBS 207.26]
FTDEEFRKLKQADAYTAKEKQVLELVIPIIKSKIKNVKYYLKGILFTNLNSLINSILKFKLGNLDVYYNTYLEQLS